MDCSCGEVVAPRAVAASWSTAAAQPTIAAPIAARPIAVPAVATMPPTPPPRVEIAPPTCPVMSCLPPSMSAPPLDSAPQPIPQAALGMLSSATGETPTGLAAAGGAVRADTHAAVRTASTASLGAVI